MDVAQVAILVLETVLIGQVTWAMRKIVQIERRLSALEAKSKFYNELVKRHLA